MFKRGRPAAARDESRQSDVPGEPWSRRAGNAAAAQARGEAVVQRSTVHEVLRSTGRPLDDTVRTDMETRLGADFSSVRVHDDAAARRSAAEVGAKAYTSGEHVVLGAGGPDRHVLAHELTHVIQQRQGPVAGTTTGDGLKISDPGDRFERAAEANATRALAGNPPAEGASVQRTAATPVIQRWPDVQATDFRQFLAEQEQHRAHLANAQNDVTTVGFEHEFAQMKGGPLQGVSHLVIAKEPPPNAFELETDASNELELVSPPFLVKTVTGASRPIPDPSTVGRIDGLIRRRLEALLFTGQTLGGLIRDLSTDPGLGFTLAPLTVKAENLTGKTAEKYSSGSPKVDATDLSGIEVVKSTKMHDRAIDTQVNFATTAGVADLMETVSTREGADVELVFSGLQEMVRRFLGEAYRKHETGSSDRSVETFLNALARSLSGQLAVPSIEHIYQAQHRAFQDGGPDAYQKAGLQDDVFPLHTVLSSKVKDVGGVWTKDTLVNVGRGLFSGPGEQQRWQSVIKVMNDPDLHNLIRGLTPPTVRTDVDEQEALEKSFAQAKTLMVGALDILTEEAVKIMEGRTSELTPLPKRPDFMTHDEALIGPRQDTYIPAADAQMEAWPGTTLHVVEGRSEPETALAATAAAHLITDRPDRTDQQIVALVGLAGYTEQNVRDVRNRLVSAALTRELPHDEVARRFGLTPAEVATHPYASARKDFWLYIPTGEDEREKQQRGEAFQAWRVNSNKPKNEAEDRKRIAGTPYLRVTEQDLMTTPRSNYIRQILKDAPKRAVPASPARTSQFIESFDVVFGGSGKSLQSQDIDLLVRRIEQERARGRSLRLRLTGFSTSRFSSSAAKSISAREASVRDLVRARTGLLPPALEFEESVPGQAPLRSDAKPQVVAELFRV